MRGCHFSHNIKIKYKF